MVSHVIDLGRKGDRWHPKCSCRWTGTATRWATAAITEGNDHLAAVGAKKIPSERSTKARRYLGQRGSVA